ncbi:replication initiation protein [Butyrivibrio hungatei]|uniref:replication initiation protein n=1 Tax=Butyrivibrio hungatei TaxID=185008 RepID=UPI001876E820|nr:replication initiation protein [Butyrivibrio hungatei]
MKTYEINPKHKYAQKNTMITASFDHALTTHEQKLLRIAIASIDTVKENEFIETKVPLSTLQKLIPENKFKNTYRDIEKACRVLVKTTIEIIEPRKKATFYPLFSKIEYNYGEGCFTFQFNPHMNEYLLNLKNSFTQIPLEDILNMNHKYSMKVYELIRSKLKNNPGTENRYPQIKEFKHRVLYPALEDIAKFETARIHCNVTDIKENRRIIAFKLDCWSINGWDYIQRQKGQIEGQIDMFQLGL